MRVHGVLLLLALDVPAAWSSRPAALAKIGWKRASLSIAAAGLASYVSLSILPAPAAANNAGLPMYTPAGAVRSITVAKADASGAKLASNPGGDLLNGLVSGGLIKVTKELVLHPIETVKARVQVASPSRNESAAEQGAGGMPLLGQLGATYSQPGLYKGLYDGIVPSLVGGIPAGAVFFGAKDYIKSALKATGSFSKAERTVLAVVLANLPYWLLRTPSEMLKTRAQVVRAEAGAGKGAGVGDAWGEVRSEWQEGGAAGVWALLYGSYASNLAYALPADVIKFLAYESLTTALLHKESGVGVSGPEAALVGALASLLAQLATTPLDLARTRVMTRQDALGSSPSSGNPFVVLQQIWREGETQGGGLQQVFRGTTPRAVRALASGAVQFATYEVTQTLLGGQS